MTRPDLSADGFALTLAVQIAALVAVLRTPDEAAGHSARTGPTVLADPAAASRELLVREVDHWQKMKTRTPDPVTLSRPVMARAVLIATLTRGLPPAAALELLDELRVGPDPQTVIDDHGQCYPVGGRGHVLEPLYPDRLGEDFIAALLPGAKSEPDGGLPIRMADQTAVSIVKALACAERHAPVRTPVWTILVEVARRWPHVAATLLPWLHETPGLLVRCGGTVVARAASIPALAPALPKIGNLLDTIIGAGSI